MAERFADLEEPFLRFTREIVWCTVTTVSPEGRPRSRILHPVWEVVDGRPVGWVFTGRTPVKTRHLAANPHVAFSYWTPSHDTVLGEAVASWVEDQGAKQHVWDLITTAPPPLGYDLAGFGLSGPQDPAFTPLRLDATRVQVLDGSDVPKDFKPRMAVIEPR
ncbi:pyridoxamine 5'-phosphate oxidase family protein [Actinomadura kijaniata]|uniref:pyridoxamine 5'-phosphate oxidase family protein n=1 Tax=Actinomadura kijaniata TaxID=46161 RepID=UPI00082CAD13|nr:pyridoxamine 5'-phosphate oxidase family protein [Actinomadura kijaniata]